MGMRRGGISHNEWGDYLNALANGKGEKESVRQANLLFSFAELKFRMAGGGHCSVCHAHVRHVLPIEVEREDGSTKQYGCLCTRCLVAEKSTARRVTLRVGNARVEYTRPSKLNVASESRPMSEARAASGK